MPTNNAEVGEYELGIGRNLKMLLCGVSVAKLGSLREYASFFHWLRICAATPR
jgi:hypothetical protein